MILTACFAAVLAYIREEVWTEVELTDYTDCHVPHVRDNASHILQFMMRSTLRKSILEKEVFLFIGPSLSL